MHLEDYQTFDATGLAELIRRREVSQAEVFDAAVAAIETLNPSLHAVVRTRFEKAKHECDHVLENSVFAGVPTLSKDLLMALAGEPLAFGSASLSAWCPKQDSLIIQRVGRQG